MRRRAQTASDALFEITEQQQGYFTARQATKCGYQLGSQAHHVKSGNWVRVERGIYRFVHFPQSDQEQLVIYSLWSRSRSGEPEGVYSHQTALSIHELSDVNPARLHMTVPVTFRRRAKPSRILVLHRASLDEDEVEQRQGFAVTRPLRSIADLAASESVSRDIVVQAFFEGRQRGLITVREISELRHRGQFPKWFDDLLMANK
jgi:predicted transcriptional regulator of viral defense system